MPTKKVLMVHSLIYSDIDINLVSNLVAIITSKTTNAVNDIYNLLERFEILKHLILVSQHYPDLLNYCFYYSQVRILDVNNKIIRRSNSYVNTLLISSGFMGDLIIMSRSSEEDKNARCIDVGISACNYLRLIMPNFVYTYPAVNSSSATRVEMMGVESKLFCCNEYVKGIRMDSALKTKEGKRNAENWLKQILSALINAWYYCRFKHGKLVPSNIIIRDNIPVMTSFWHSTYNPDMIDDNVYVSDDEPYNYDEFDSLVRACVEIVGADRIVDIKKQDTYLYNRPNMSQIIGENRRYNDGVVSPVNVADINIRSRFCINNYTNGEMHQAYINTVEWIKSLSTRDNICRSSDLFMLKLCNLNSYSMNPHHATFALMYYQIINYQSSLIDEKCEAEDRGYSGSETDDQDEYDTTP